MSKGITKTISGWVSDFVFHNDIFYDAAANNVLVCKFMDMHAVNIVNAVDGVMQA